MTEEKKTKSLAEVGEMLRHLHVVKGSPWRDICQFSEYYPIPAGTLASIAKGREPKNPKVRTQLGLPALVPAPACSICGQVHIKPNCPSVRKPYTKVTDGMTDLEASFLTFCRQLEIPEPMKQYRFMVDRQYKFDFAWPENMWAVEMEGIFMKGEKKSRHTTGVGYSNDCEKYNWGVLLGWKVFRFTAVMLTDGRADKQLSTLWGKE